jgi:hypothetical protein
MLLLDVTVVNVARGAQGVGAAAMFSASLVLLADEFQGRERGLALGVWGAILVNLPDEIQARLSSHLEEAMDRVADAATRFDMRWREAAQAVAIARLAEAVHLRAVYP